MTDVRASQLLAALPRGEFMMKLKFLGERAEGNWVVKDKSDPVQAKRKKRQGIIEISQNTKPGALTGINSVFYQNAYPVTTVVYGLYPVSDPDPANLVPVRDGDRNSVAQRVMEHFESALRGQGLTPKRRQKIQDWKEGVHETGATIEPLFCEILLARMSTILTNIRGKTLRHIAN